MDRCKFKNNVIVKGGKNPANSDVDRFSPRCKNISFGNIPQKKWNKIFGKRKR